MRGQHLITDYFAKVRLFGRNARLYLLSLALFGISGGIVALLFNFYVLALGRDQAWLGQLLTVNNSAALIVALPAGYLSDRLGRRRSLLLAGLGSVAALGAMAVSQEAAVLFAFYILMGVAGSLAAVTLAPFLMENSGEEERTYLFSATFGLQILAGMIGFTIGGRLPSWIATLVGVESTSPAAYGRSLFVAALLGLLALLPLLFIRRSDPAQTEQRPSDEPLVPLRYARRQSGLLARLLVPVMITTIGAGLFVPFMNIFFRQTYQASDATIGNLLAAGSLVMGLGLLAAPPFTDRYGKVRVFILCQALSIPFMALLGFAPWLWLSAIGYLVRIMLMNMAIPVYQAFVMEQVEADARGIVAALLSMAYSFGYAISPAISGRLQMQVGFSSIFFIAIALYALAIGLYWRFFWRPAQPATALAQG